MTTISQFTPIISPESVFDFTILQRFCEADADEFGDMLGMTRTSVAQPAPDDFYWFKDNGSNILAVAHLDTVCGDRRAVLAQTAGGDVVYSGALDDRLGAYVLGALLPDMGLTFDLLLTTGEESGMSTASFFDPAEHHDRTYDWIIEFDRGGTDVVMYQYEDDESIRRVEESGAKVGNGSFSDIAFLEHLRVKAFNWGVGYRDYHGPRGHVWLDDMFYMVDLFVKFHAMNGDTHMPHEMTSSNHWWGMSRPRSKTEVIEADLSQCEEHESDAEGCGGDMLDTPYGLLCTDHWQWYAD